VNRDSIFGTDGLTVMSSPLCPNTSWDPQYLLRRLVHSSKRQRGRCRAQSNYLSLLSNNTTNSICTSKRADGIVMYPYAHCV